MKAKVLSSSLMLLRLGIQLALGFRHSLSLWTVFIEFSCRRRQI
ncbi:hypothetical protein KR49_02450 [Synechococcus sp. KORDI-49]|nr:hypothetical protein KR49_02450 [Synechococcus sp. KORDI-49]